MKRLFCLIIVISFMLSISVYNRLNIPSLEIVAIATGNSISYAIDSDGNLWAWGDNSNGQIGDSTVTTWHYSRSPLVREAMVYNNRHTPIKVLDSVVSVSVGFLHTMAIRTDGSLWAWGINEAGEVGTFGNGTTESSYTPIKVMESVSAVSIGSGFVLAIKNDGSLWSWGRNDSGQLGDGTTEHRYAPVKIMDSVIYISAGIHHPMAITADGGLWAWGCNRYGQLSDTVHLGRFAQTYPVQILDSVVSVSADARHTMAVKSDGSLWVWGGNWVSQSRDVPVDEYEEYWLFRPTPTIIMDTVVSVSVGMSHAMAVREDGSLWAWGYDFNGLIGSVGNTANGMQVQFPIKIMDSVTMVSTSDRHTLVLKEDGSVWAWGSNMSGQLGDSTTVHRPRPVKIIAPKD